MIFSDEYYMRIALEEARKAAEQDEIPVGAILVDDKNNIVARSGNLTSHNSNPLGHAEKLVIEQALQNDENFLYNYTLYVTLEPCVMCCGIILLSRLGRLVFGAADPKAGAAGSLYNLPKDRRLNHNPQLTSGVLQKECSQILKNFFRSKRR